MKTIRIKKTVMSGDSKVLFEAGAVLKNFPDGDSDLLIEQGSAELVEAPKPTVKAPAKKTKKKNAPVIDPDDDDGDDDDGDDDTASVVVKLMEPLIKSTIASTMKGLGVRVGSNGNIAAVAADSNKAIDFEGGSTAFVKAVFASTKQLTPDMAMYIKKVEDDIKRKGGTGINEAVGEEGGFLVPTEMSAAIYKKALGDGVDFAGQTDRFPVGGNSQSFPVAREDSRATGSRHGGVTGYWVDEGAQFTASQPKFDKMQLRLHKLAVLVYVTSEMLEDPILPIDRYLTDLASDEINFMVNDALIRGDGVTKPLGILKVDGNGAAVTGLPTLTINRSNANRVGMEDLDSMWERMPPRYRGLSQWLANQEVEKEFKKLHYQHIVVDGGGSNPSAYPILSETLTRDQDGVQRINGRPVIITEFAEALGTRGDVMLAVWPHYATIVKGGSAGGVKSAMSIHLRFDFDESVFRFTFRIDGKPWWSKAVTPFKGTNTLSPFIALGPIA